MRIFLISILILFCSCRSSAEVSFDNLNKAFINWYFKYHPVEALKYNININRDFKLSTKLEIDEYYADLSRFLIELSQIDITKISQDSRIDYEILYAKLEELKFIFDEIKPWEWNPLWTLDNIYESLYLMSERLDIDMDKRVSSIEYRLQKIPQFLEDSKTLKIKFSSVHSNYAISKTDDIILLLQQLPLKLNSDNITLDKIDLLIRNSILALENYKQWNIINSSNLEKILFPEDLSLLDNGFSHFVGNMYLADLTYIMAMKKLISIQNRMFSLALPSYLKDNDEPVWLDRADTLEVIRWTLEGIYKNPKNKINADQVLSKYYESLVNIEKYCFKGSLFPTDKNKSIRLEFAPEHSSSNIQTYLFEDRPKDFSRELVYSIKYLENEEGQYNLIKQEIDILNIINVSPGYGLQLAYTQNNSSMIRYLFPNSVNKLGWKFYALSTLIDEGYGNWDKKYHILKLKEELGIIVKTIIENQYYSGEIDRKESIKFINDMAFMKDYRIDSMLKDIDLNYFSGTLSFIGLMEYNSLFVEYKRIQKNEFYPSQFHKLILSQGSIPIKELKKIF